MKLYRHHVGSTGANLREADQNKKKKIGASYNEFDMQNYERNDQICHR